jgi:hypothetical protein
MIKTIKKQPSGFKFLFVVLTSGIIATLCSFITPKIGEAIRIISILSVFDTSATIDWTTPTPVGIFYGYILNLVIFILLLIVLWIYFGTNILEKLKE